MCVINISQIIRYVKFNVSVNRPSIFFPKNTIFLPCINTIILYSLLGGLYFYVDCTLQYSAFLRVSHRLRRNDQQHHSQHDQTTGEQNLQHRLRKLSIFPLRLLRSPTSPNLSQLTPDTWDVPGAGPPVGQAATSVAQPWRPWTEPHSRHDRHRRHIPGLSDTGVHQSDTVVSDQLWLWAALLLLLPYQQSASLSQLVLELCRLLRVPPAVPPALALVLHAIPLRLQQQPTVLSHGGQRPATEPVVSFH